MSVTRVIRPVVLTASIAALALSTMPAQAVGQGAPTSTKTRTVERSPQPTPHVVGVRTGEHKAFDRVVIDLKGGAPGYTVGYVRQVHEDGSGKAVETRGHADLLIRLTPANAHHENGSPTYDGPKRFTVNYPSLREVAFAGDFEATVAIALGVREKSGFRVLTLTDPTRIVVDIAH